MQDVRELDRDIVRALAAEVRTLAELDARLPYPLDDLAAAVGRLGDAGIIQGEPAADGSLVYCLRDLEARALDWIDSTAREPDPSPQRAARLDALIDGAIHDAENADRANFAVAAAAVDRLLSARLAARELESPNVESQLLVSHNTAGIVEPQLLKAAAVTLRRVAEMLARVEEHQGRLAPPDGPADLAQSHWQPVRVLPRGFEDIDPGELARLAGLLAAGSR